MTRSTRSLLYRAVGILLLAVFAFVVACKSEEPADGHQGDAIEQAATPEQADGSTQSTAPQDQATASPQAERQEESGSIWTQRAPLLQPYSEFAVAEVAGKIYVIGGYPSTRVYVNTVQVYDPATDS